MEKKPETPAADSTPKGKGPSQTEPKDPAKAAAKKKEKEEQKAAKQAAYEKKLAEKKAKEEVLKKKKEEDAAKGDKPEGKKSKTKIIRRSEPYNNPTPKGEKKDCSKALEQSYHPPQVEAAWYDWWLQKGFFKADNKSTKEKFVIVIPPPNVTGALHIGHALMNSLEDALCRWNRMCGKEVLWVPGTDHAGIATQQAVEKKLAKEKKPDRRTLGREPFVAEVWRWKDTYATRICNQLKRMGSSLDWSRECFTMDEKLSRAVITAFVRMYDQGLIYRDLRLTNWDCTLNTAVSDIEVDDLELDGPTKVKVPEGTFEFGVIISFAYPIEGGGEILVATTRPETMLADTAVAIHPDDERYKHLHGKFVLHPLVDRKIPIVLDPVLVDPKFGTGAVKVTPAHDPNDYDCGKRHNLAFINLLNDDGTINEMLTRAAGGKFKGMKRFAARQAVIESLKEKGLYRGTAPNKMVLGVCSRSGDIIEPIIKPQWYVRCTEMGERAVKAVRDGRLEIVPPSNKEVWYRWMENIHDWCISRQLWWGHRIPAFLCHVEGRPAPDPNLGDDWVIAATKEEALQKATQKYGVDISKIKMEQDSDVLDTWFSSVFGWPDQTEDMKAFYPTSTLETGTDILFFWVARMVMMGQQLTGQLPFTKVYLHAMIRDAHGRKMSKSLGNVIDPIDVIEGINREGLEAKVYEGNLPASEVETAIAGIRKDYPEGINECGTDALRFALCAYSKQELSINMDVNKVLVYRNFCNKMWNATKFALMNLNQKDKPAFVPNPTSDVTGEESIIEKWILSRLSHAIVAANAGLRDFMLGIAADAIYRFWWEELCDVFLEASKPIFASSDAKAVRSAQNTLYTCLDLGLNLLHPFMPFVSEELWQHIPRRPGDTTESLVIAAYPTEAKWENKELDEKVSIALHITHIIRALKQTYGIQPKQKPNALIRIHNDDLYQMLSANFQGIIAILVGLGKLDLQLKGDAPLGCAVTIVDKNVEVYLHIKGMVDLAAEIARLEKSLAKLHTELAALNKRIATQQNAPAEVIAKNKEKIASLEAEIKQTEEALKGFNDIKESK